MQLCSGEEKSLAIKMQIFMFLGFRAKAKILVPFIYWYWLFTTPPSAFLAQHGLGAQGKIIHLPTHSFLSQKVKAYTHIGNSFIKSKHKIFIVYTRLMNQSYEKNLPLCFSREHCKILLCLALNSCPKTPLTLRTHFIVHKTGNK